MSNSELNGDLGFQITNYGTKGDSTNDGKTSVIHCVTEDLTEELAEAACGKELAAALFQGFVGGSGETAQKEFKLRREHALGQLHKVSFEIAGKKYEAQATPVFEKVVPAKTGREVTVHFKALVAIVWSDLRHALDDNVLAGWPVATWGGVVQQEMFEDGGSPEDPDEPAMRDFVAENRQRADEMASQGDGGAA